MCEGAAPWLCLAVCLRGLRADRELVKLAVQQGGYALEYASEELRADRELVKLAVQPNGLALEYAAEELRAGIQIVKLTVQQDGMALPLASAAMYDIREIVLLAWCNGGPYAMGRLADARPAMGKTCLYRVGQVRLRAAL